MTGALILLHPAMTGQEAHAWCQRHQADLDVQHRQGKVHLVVVATPRAPYMARPTEYACTGCGWAGSEPDWIRDEIYGEIPSCPRCEAAPLYPPLLRSSP
jgi:hypothetical protein